MTVIFMRAAWYELADMASLNMCSISSPGMPVSRMYRLTVERIAKTFPWSPEISTVSGCVLGLVLGV